MEKFGLTKASTTCPQSYLDNNSVDQRIWDYLRVIQSLRGASWWNGQLLIAGGSEGGVIASVLASFIPETKKLAILAGGTGWTMREQMLFLLGKKLRTEGFDEQIVQLELKKMAAVFAEAIANPVSTKFYAGSTNTYKWWNSILSIRPRNLMIDPNIPILMVQGGADTAVPVESARETEAIFKANNKVNLTYIEYPDLDHSWNDSNGNNQSAVVFGDVFRWLLQ